MADLTLRQIKKAYGSLNILHGIDLDIKSGEFIVFVGPSGCGKSTLLRTIAGLEEITSGDAARSPAGSVNDVPPSKRGIAMVFQSYALYPHMTVYDNMAFGMKIARENKAEIDRRVRQAAEILQLTKYLDRLPKAMSGGQRQRVAIGRAIVRNPKVFLFDEPLSNLDAALRVATRIEIAKLKESHAQHHDDLRHPRPGRGDDARRPHRRAEGRPCRAGRHADGALPPSGQPVRRAVHRLAGDEHRAGDDREGRARRLPSPCRRAARSTFPSRRPPMPQATSISFGVRPEDLRIATGENVLFEGRVDYVEQLGEVQLVYLDIGRADVPLVVKLPGNAEVKRDAGAQGRRRPGTLHIFNAEGRSFASVAATAKAA